MPAVAASTFDPDAADALLREHGCVVIEGVVPRAACAAASTLVDSLLAEALSRCGQTSTSDDVSGSSDDALAAAHRLFGNVLAPTRRRDLRVPLAEAIRACVYPALERLRPVLAATLTEDALVAELSALVCDPGAAAQPLHPDTQILGARSAAPLLTAFIALDDVLAPERGPTEIVLRSHDAAAHDALRAAAPSAAAAAAAAAPGGRRGGGFGGAPRRGLRRARPRAPLRGRRPPHGLARRAQGLRERREGREADAVVRHAPGSRERAAGKHVLAPAGIPREAAPANPRPVGRAERRDGDVNVKQSAVAIANGGPAPRRASGGTSSSRNIVS